MDMTGSMRSTATMTIVNMVTNGVLEAMFNPSEFEEVLAASYAKQKVPGLSHTVKQFSNTEDAGFTFELFYRVTDEGQRQLQRILDARLFLTSLVHPRRNGSLTGGGPPRCLFIWPSFITVESVVTGVRFKYNRFNRSGSPVSYTAAVTLEAIRDRLVTMEDVLGR